MTRTTASRYVRRYRGDWMTMRDDTILETIYDEGNLSPQAIEDMGITDRSYASTRMSTLTRAGLLRRVASGLYGLTDEGRAYLEGEFDASTVSPD